MNIRSQKINDLECPRCNLQTVLEEGEDDEGEWVCNVCPECEHNIEKKDDFVLRKVGICDVDIISKYKGSKLISSTAFLEMQRY